MPKFFMILGFWIGRFSNEEKRPHVHAVKFGTEEEMKVWLEPEVESGAIFTTSVRRESQQDTGGNTEVQR